MLFSVAAVQAPEDGILAIGRELVGMTLVGMKQAGMKLDGTVEWAPLGMTQVGRVGMSPVGTIGSALLGMAPVEVATQTAVDHMVQPYPGPFDSIQNAVQDMSVELYESITHFQKITQLINLPCI